LEGDRPAGLASSAPSLLRPAGGGGSAAGHTPQVDKRADYSK
jgi:hypothetical protein